MPRLLSKQDSFNSSGATIIPERESDLRSTSITAANALASLDSARVLMPQDTLGRELDGWIKGGGNENAVESQEIDFANAVMSYTQLPLETQSTTDLTSFISRSNPDLAALVNPSMSPVDILAKLQLENPNWNTARAPSNPSPFVNKHEPLPTGAYSPNEPFRPETARSHQSHHSHRSDVSSEYSYCTTEVDEDEANQLEIDPKQLHTRPGQASDVPAALPRAKGKAGRTAQAGAPYPTPGNSAGGPSPPVRTGAHRGVGENEEDLRLKRLEHRRQINRKSAQKHRMRRREEHDNLSKSMVEKDARIAQLEKELAVEKSKTAQLQQFIDMQRGGSGGKRSGGRRKEDTDMDDW